MTEKLLGLLLVTDLLPFWQARQGNARSTLTHAIHWAAIAWLGWLMTVALSIFGNENWERAAGYLSLCLTGGAGVAVLGARRPGAAAWNFVVLGLLAVETLPLLEGLDQLRSSPLRVALLSGTLAVALLNYVPTRLGWTALWGGLCIVPDLLLAVGPAEWSSDLIVPARCARGALTLVPWLARVSMKRRGVSSDLDTSWLAFRDPFGFFWAQRLREQFNRAASNAGWDVRLTWSGMRTTTGKHPADTTLETNAMATLQSLLRRFGTMN